MLQNLVMEHIHFVIRLKVGLPQVTLLDGAGHTLKLTARVGQPVIYRGVFYQGLVLVNGIDWWRKGFQTPVWVMTVLDPERDWRFTCSAR